MRLYLFFVELLWEAVGKDTDMPPTSGIQLFSRKHDCSLFVIFLIFLSDYTEISPVALPFLSVFQVQLVLTWVVAFLEVSLQIRAARKDFENAPKITMTWNNNRDEIEVQKIEGGKKNGNRRSHFFAMYFAAEASSCSPSTAWSVAAQRALWVIACVYVHRPAV